MGKIYMVATPIGNLADITMRAIDILSSVDLILAEDTRITRKLLDKYNIKTPLQSYHAHSSHEKKLLILNKLMQGESIALVTDAGTPGISDPGNELLDFLYEQIPHQVRDDSRKHNGNVIPPVRRIGGDRDPGSIQIIPIPGVSSLTAALSISGFKTGSFTFLGFWPKSTNKHYLDIVKNAEFTVCYFDSPHRVLKNLYKLAEVVNKNRRVLVSRELTKIYETKYRGTISEVIKMLEEEKKLKGEIVVVVESEN